MFHNGLVHCLFHLNVFTSSKRGMNMSSKTYSHKCNYFFCIRMYYFVSLCLCIFVDKLCIKIYSNLKLL